MRLFKKHNVITSEKWWVGLAGLAAAVNGSVIVAADVFSRTDTYSVVRFTGVAHQQEKY